VINSKENRSNSNPFHNIKSNAVVRLQKPAPELLALVFGYRDGVAVRVNKVLQRHGMGNYHT
jgi:hypothetical protein